jgi:hypothetical protein
MLAVRKQRGHVCVVEITRDHICLIMAASFPDWQNRCYSMQLYKVRAIQARDGNTMKTTNGMPCPLSWPNREENSTQLHKSTNYEALRWTATTFSVHRNKSSSCSVYQEHSTTQFPLQLNNRLALTYPFRRGFELFIPNILR